MNEIDRAKEQETELTAAIAQVDRDLLALRNRRFDLTADRDQARRRVSDLEFRQKRDAELVPV